MKRLRTMVLINLLVLLVMICVSCSENKESSSANAVEPHSNTSIGWASADVTPDKQVDLRGQFPARISEGIMDPITITALAIESGNGPSSKKAILISCDLIAIERSLLDSVRGLLKESLPEIEPEQIIINATHTHTAPLYSTDTNTMNRYGIELDAMAPSDYLKFASLQIAAAVERAWEDRKPGGISFGLGHAVVGHNRLAVDKTGKSVMYKNTNSPEFSHLEGYEDHSVNLLYTWDRRSKLTGVVINVACPSQVTEGLYKISADFWHETRLELRERFGEELYILPQCGAAGDQSPHIMVGLKGEVRMQQLMFPDSIKTGDRTIGLRKQIAIRIADAVTSVYPYMKDHIEWDPEFEHRMAMIDLSRRLISEEDVHKAMQESEELQREYNLLLQELQENPGIKDNPRWYSKITRTYKRYKRGQNVKERYELEKVQPKMPVEVHVLRISDVVMATNPFELYLDYGMRMKARSPAIQTFIIQLANGSEGYLPPLRSVAGGSYGAEPASTLIGPKGGAELVEKTIGLVNDVWQTSEMPL
jgi:hypothetical protein